MTVKEFIDKIKETDKQKKVIIMDICGGLSNAIMRVEKDKVILMQDKPLQE